MKFWEAMKLVDEGHKVRRSSWGDGWHVYFDSIWGDVVETNGVVGNINTTTFQDDDPTATDWILFE